jgi:hypothetical protein
LWRRGLGWVRLRHHMPLVVLALLVCLSGCKSPDTAAAPALAANDETYRALSGTAVCLEVGRKSLTELGQWVSDAGKPTLQFLTNTWDKATNYNTAGEIAVAKTAVRILALGGRAEAAEARVKTVEANYAVLYKSSGATVERWIRWGWRIIKWAMGISFLLAIVFKVLANVSGGWWATAWKWAAQGCWYVATCFIGIIHDTWHVLSDWIAGLIAGIWNKRQVAKIKAAEAAKATPGVKP